MKIIQSFWTGNKNSLTDSYGWLLPIFNYLSWIISCNLLLSDKTRKLNLYSRARMCVR